GAVVSSETLLDVPRADEAILFEACGMDGNPLNGTTVSLPRNVRMTYEYGDASVQHRLIAYTDATGTRTQYRYNDSTTEPGGELTEGGSGAGPTAREKPAAGQGTHMEWNWVGQATADPSLYPAGTFIGAPDAKGVPVVTQILRRPDNLILRSLGDY